MDFDLDNDSFLEEDYYTALNVSKNVCIVSFDILTLLYRFYNLY